MHANPKRPYLGWTALSLIATASVLSSGCARFYHAMHYNGLARSVEDHHLSYYHSAKTGRIIPKEHHQVCQVEFPCFGYEPTCWHRWPAECGNCPVQDSIGYGVNSCQTPCAPCADGVVTQDAIMSEYPQGVPVQEAMPSDAMPLDQVSPIETESAEPAVTPADTDSAFDNARYSGQALPDFTERNAARVDSPVDANADWMTARSSRPVEVETLLIPEVARVELQRTPSFVPASPLSLTGQPADSIGRLPQPVIAPTATQGIAVDDAAVSQPPVKANSAVATEPQPAAEEDSSIDAEVTRDSEQEMDELTARPNFEAPANVSSAVAAPTLDEPAAEKPAFEVIETTRSESAPANATDITPEVVEVAADVPTFRIKPTLPPALARKPVAAVLPPVKMAPVEVKAEDKSGISVRFVSERSSDAQPVVAEKPASTTESETSLKFR